MHSFHPLRYRSTDSVLGDGHASTARTGRGGSTTESLLVPTTKSVVGQHGEADRNTKTENCAKQDPEYPTAAGQRGEGEQHCGGSCQLSASHLLFESRRVLELPFESAPGTADDVRGDFVVVAQKL